MGDSAKTVQHSIKNISRNIKAVFFKLGIRNAYQKKRKKNYTVVRFHDNSYDAAPVIIQTKILRRYLKQASSIPKNLMGRAKIIRGPREFRARPSVPL